MPNKNDGWDRNWLNDHQFEPTILVVPNLGGPGHEMVVATTLGKAIAEVTAFKRLYTYRAVDIVVEDYNSYQAHFLEIQANA